MAHEIYDIRKIAQEMRGDAPFQRGGHTARTLTRNPDLRIVAVVMNAGNVIKDHKVDDTAQVSTFSGHVRLRLADEMVDLPAGHVMVIERGVVHNVEAVEESVFILTLGGSA